MNEDELGKQFNQLQSSDNELITPFFNTEHENESDNSSGKYVRL